MVNGTDVTNTHETYEEVTVSGSKTWNHGSNDTRRPESIVVYVKNGNEAVAAKRVTASDNWQWSFVLPKYDDNGNIAVYTIVEENVPYYTLTGNDGYSLINKFVSFNYPGDNSPSVRPKTGDSRSLWLWIGLMAASGTAFVILFIKRCRLKRIKTSCHDK